MNQREGLWVMNNQGEALRQLPASAPDILRAARDFGLDTADLATLADQMDAKGTAHPSVDLRSLAQGGMGTSHDWTSDPLAHLKGPGAQDTLAANVQLAQELGLAPGTDTVARTAAPPAVPTAAAGGASSPENLGNQLTNTLLAQMQNALKNWQTQHGMS